MTYRVLYDGQMRWPWRVQSETIYGERRILASFSTRADADTYIFHSMIPPLTPKEQSE